jgi:hypothetical protein
MKNSSEHESGGEEHPSKLSELAVFWLLFKQSFPLEADCVEELYNRLGVRCRSCGADDLVRRYGERTSKCRACQKTVRMTAGTFFEGIRRVEPWLGAIWLLEQGVSFSASEFRTCAKMAYSSIWEMLKKIAIVIQHEMDVEPLAVSVSSSLFIPIVNRRSRETPAKAHPTAEEVAMERNESNVADDAGAATQQGASTSEAVDENPTRALSEVEQLIFENLSFEPKHIDVLCLQTSLEMHVLGATLLLMELDGLVQQNAGDTYSQTKQCKFSKPSGNCSEPLETIDMCISFVRTKFHGIARKYLQYYLAVFWCSVNRIKWTTGKLLDRCARYRTIRRAEILAFVTPLSVKIVPA